MHRELNKNEFFIVLRGYQDASDLYENGYYREALLELKPALKLLERDAVITRMLAKCRFLEGQACLKLNQNKRAEKAFADALRVLTLIHDTSTMAEEIFQICPRLRPAAPDMFGGQSEISSADQ